MKKNKQQKQKQTHVFLIKVSCIVSLLLLLCHSKKFIIILSYCSSSDIDINNAMLSKTCC